MPSSPALLPKRFTKPLKDVFNTELVAITAQVLKSRCQDLDIHFDDQGFIAQATEQFSSLELKQRSQQIQQALAQHLPQNFDVLCRILQMALHPIETNQDLDDIHLNEQGLCGWIIMPMSDLVGESGQQNPELALETLKQMTQRFSSEFGIRHLLLTEPHTCLEIMQDWVNHPCHHVRRLVSEGTRPLLPWAMQLPEFKAQPNWVLALLSSLKDDESEYVRRSVANHLNDISKTHPDLIADIAQEWVVTADQGPSAHHRKRLVKHACRTLIKAGHSKTLSVFGYDSPEKIKVDLRLSLPSMVLGQHQEISCVLKNYAAKPAPLLLDYVVRHVKANGKQTSKTFKWTSLELEPNESVELNKVHKIVPISTRRYYTGEHAIEIQINGKKLAEASFWLEV